MSGDHFHRSTALVCELMDALLLHGGWTAFSALLARDLAHRQTLEAAIAELAARGWVERRERDNEAWLRPGPELPRIGLAYLRQLTAEQEDLERRAIRAAAVVNTLVPGTSPGRRSS